MKLILLSNHFYELFSSADEILQKQTRPYACLAVKIDGLTYAIPFRHHISHKHAFFTGEGKGLDFTKAVVVRDNSFISADPVRVEQSEFDAVKTSEQRIVAGMRKFIKLYRKAVRYTNNPAYAAIRDCSALQYFPECLKADDFPW